MLLAGFYFVLLLDLEREAALAFLIRLIKMPLDIHRFIMAELRVAFPDRGDDEVVRGGNGFVSVGISGGGFLVGVVVAGLGEGRRRHQKT